MVEQFDFNYIRFIMGLEINEYFCKHLGKINEFGVEKSNTCIYMNQFKFIDLKSLKPFKPASDIYTLFVN